MAQQTIQPKQPATFSVEEAPAPVASNPVAPAAAQHTPAQEFLPFQEALDVSQTTPESATDQSTQKSEESPMEITERAKTKVQTSADLPEIKVAEPVEQDDPLLNEGEDFLEKTGNFIGRIKWSIFNEDR